MRGILRLLGRFFVGLGHYLLDQAEEGIWVVVYSCDDKEGRALHFMGTEEFEGTPLSLCGGVLLKSSTRMAVRVFVSFGNPPPGLCKTCARIAGLKTSKARRIGPA